MKLAHLVTALVPFLLVGCSDAPSPEEIIEPSLTQVPEVPKDGEGPLVAFVGDSITAGLHVDERDSFPAVLERRFADRGTPFRRIQAGVSGDTTAGGLRRIDWILKQWPDVVVIELGGNDGLRGIPIETIEENLRGMLTKVRENDVEAVLLGIRLYENYADYATKFDALYPRLAEETGSHFVPYFMEGVGGVPELNVEDQLHPNAEGHAKLAGNLEDVLAVVVQRVTERSERDR